MKPRGSERNRREKSQQAQTRRQRHSQNITSLKSVLPGSSVRDDAKPPGCWWTPLLYSCFHEEPMWSESASEHGHHETEPTCISTLNIPVSHAWTRAYWCQIWYPADHSWNFESMFLLFESRECDYNQTNQPAQKCEVGWDFVLDKRRIKNVTTVQNECPYITCMSYNKTLLRVVWRCFLCGLILL